MLDLRHRSLRLAMGLAVVVLVLVEVQGLVQTLGSQTRQRDRIVRGTRDAVLAASPRLAAALRPGGPPSWAQAAEEARRSSLAAECEVFELSGYRLFSRPAASPAGHWPTADEIEAIRQGSVLTVGPITRTASRLLTYAAFPSGERSVLLRLSTPVPELVEDLRERRQVLLSHGLALLVLVLAGGLILLPYRDASEAPPQRALDAYEAAMERLRDRGQELSREYEAQRRRMEDQIQDREAMARAGDLAAGIAHEVRNGLGTILGYARMLERGEPDSETAGVARSIREECETLESVIRRFMDFVKRETLNRAPFDLGRMLSRVVARECRSHPGCEVALPEASEIGTLVGDEELLERAFENLIRNAREAAGSIGRVVVEVEQRAGTMAVTVSDDGPGLPREARDVIRPFFTTKAGGLGLGLPLAFKIVRLHGGDLLLADRAPHGLAVTVRLPEAGGADSPVTMSSARAEGSAGARPPGHDPTS